jgi:hypothetical protein
MRFSLAYNDDGSILTTTLADEDARRPPRTDTSDLLDTTNQGRAAELNDAMEDLQDEMARRQSIQEDTQQEAHDGQL